MNKNECPPGAPVEPILCCQCLAEYRAKFVWLNLEALLLTCEIHGPIWTAQLIESG